VNQQQVSQSNETALIKEEAINGVQTKRVDTLPVMAGKVKYRRQGPQAAIL
jgi:hypothetical protein